MENRYHGIAVKKEWSYIESIMLRLIEKSDIWNRWKKLKDE